MKRNEERRPAAEARRDDACREPPVLREPLQGRTHAAAVDQRRADPGDDVRA